MRLEGVARIAVAGLTSAAAEGGGGGRTLKAFETLRQRRANKMQRQRGGSVVLGEKNPYETRDKKVTGLTATTAHGVSEFSRNGEGGGAAPRGAAGELTSYQAVLVRREGVADLGLGLVLPSPARAGERQQRQEDL